MARTQTATLLINGQDRHGLVAAVGGFIADHGGNILHADQHRDEDEDLFLQRIEWDLINFQIPRANIQTAFSQVAQPLGMHWRLCFSDERRQVALFVSKQGHCLIDLLARFHAGQLAADVRLVVSNHPDLEPFAHRFGAEFLHLPVTKENKAEQETALITQLKARGIDLIVLARYMQILTPAFTAQFPNRIINIHHSFLPAFPGARPYHRAHARGVKIIGATAHYVTADLDEGPIIEQDVVRASHRDTVADLIAKGRDLEKVVLARAVAWELKNRILVYGNKTVVFV